MNHERTVLNMLDWIGSIGGVFPIFLILMQILFKGYSEYLQNLSMIYQLKEIKSKIEGGGHNHDSGPKKGDDKGGKNSKSGQLKIVNSSKSKDGKTAGAKGGPKTKGEREDGGELSIFRKL